jgi:hypothetical protein
MYRRVKFKVGQVWCQMGTNNKYLIEAIHKDGLVTGKRVASKELRNFIHVDKNHLAEIDTTHWYQIVPRECPCGIHRNSCSYHQLESYQRLEQ